VLLVFAAAAVLAVVGFVLTVVGFVCRDMELSNAGAGLAVVAAAFLILL
jgi:hypothetical protein